MLRKIRQNPEEFRNIIREVVREEVSRVPEKLYSATQAMKILGIADHRTFIALGLEPKIRGKRKYYSLKDS